MRRRFASWAAALIVVPLIAGCGGATREEDTVNDDRAILLARPDIEEISERYEEMQERITTRLSAELGPWEWVNDRNMTRSGCADFPHVGGESRSLDRRHFRGNLPDTQWSTAVEIVTEITGEYGFGEPEVIVDRVDDHEIVGRDSFGARYTFGTAANTLLSVATGCHLPPEADRG
ncbi:hypothetical protein FHR81_002924 [Actinoalloteichus hoggarensis]|uniref:Uncharacterized protein n=1 Tax=Actinoalloteichus hoggarensis TaxID=1470176 RepID=A0A221VY94_9PSEU|nr:LppA family lipoprotein [Actinoalloteichus hoggarensis]ASO18516.1 hypothetical protein AHOG_04300 [Actinoalloteichus hoggarensis]MBB5921884.1 hypothetical protein [Actinoalloteichus hoggarensis]